MTQPNDPWGNQQHQPNQPQQPQPYVFPQQGYGQPYQQPSQLDQRPVLQQQHPQVGYFGGEPEPKRGMPWWGWVIIVVVALVVIGAIGNALKGSSTTSTNPTSQAIVVATTAPVIAPTQRVTAPTATVAQAVVPNPTTQRPIPTALPTPTALPAAVDLTINGAHSQVNVNTRTPNAANSVFYIIDFTVVNHSDKPLLTSPLYFKIQSKQNFSYEYSDVTYLLPKGYKSTTLAPNETTRGEIAFELPNGETLISARYEDVFGNKITKPTG